MIKTLSNSRGTGNIDESINLDVPTSRAWAKAIALRLSDEWSGGEEFPEDAKLLQEVLERCLVKSPRQMMRLVGTGIMEADYFEPL